MTSEPIHLLALIVLPLLLALIFNATIKKNMIFNAAAEERSVKEASKKGNLYALLLASGVFVAVLFATNQCLIPKGFAQLNQVPIIIDATITPQEVFTTTELTCSSTVLDDNLPITPTYRWNIAGNTYEGDTITLNNEMVSPHDTITCDVEAMDKHGEKATTSSSVKVQNTPPKVSAKLNVEGVGNSAKLTCSATASDAEDSQEPEISYEWFNQQDYFIGTENPLQLEPMIGGAGDQIKCVATAKDRSGGTTTDSVEHTITNTPPYMDFVQLSPSAPNEKTTTISCHASGSDVDADNVTLRYTWLVNNKKQTETSSELTGPFPVGDTIACEVTPNDGTSDGKPKKAKTRVRCTKSVSFSGLNMESLSSLEDVETAKNWSEDALIIGYSPKSSVISWKVAYVDILVMIPSVHFSSLSRNEKVTVNVYDFDDPRYAEPWSLSKRINPSEHTWSDFTLPPGSFNSSYRENKGTWVRFDFRNTIPNSGMRSNRFVVGVALQSGSKIGVGYSNFNRDCSTNWTLSPHGRTGWKLWGASQGHRCSWPMMNVFYENSSISNCQ